MRPTDDTLIAMGDIRARFKLGRTAAYGLVRRPDFPARVVISARCHRWWASEVDAFAAQLRESPPPGRSGSTRRTVTQNPSGSAVVPRRTGGRRPASRAGRKPS